MIAPISLVEIPIYGRKEPKYFCDFTLNFGCPAKILPLQILDILPRRKNEEPALIRASDVI
jgi:hypothetical protein